MKQAEILIDLYKLNLTKSIADMTGKGINAPPEDREAIIEFFEKHAPGVTTCKTAEELDTAQKEGKELGVVIGSLGLYEQQRHQSWFDANVANFYRLVEQTRNILDTHILKMPVKAEFLMWADSLARDARPIVVIEDKEGRKYSSGNAPREFDQEEYSFTRGITVTSGTLSSDSSKTELGLGPMHHRLSNALLALWNGEIKIGKCEHEGCENVFESRVRGNPRRFCTNSHRVMAQKKRMSVAATP